MKLFSGSVNSFSVHSYQKSSQPIGYHESVSPLGNINIAELPYQNLDENSRPPTPHPYHNPLRLDNQIKNHPRQGLRDHILPVNRMNNSLQFYTLTPNRVLNRITQSTAEVRFKAAVEYIGLNHHSIPTSAGIEHRTFPSPFVVNSSQFSSTDEPPFDDQGNAEHFTTSSLV